MVVFYFILKPIQNMPERHVKRIVAQLSKIISVMLITTLLRGGFENFENLIACTTFMRN